jgi:argininosuccinate lyase
MSNFIWSKGDNPKGNNCGPDEAVQKLLSGEDVILDRHLFLFDMAATIAHVNGLGRIDVLTADEVETLTKGLDDLAEEFKAGKFILDAPYEDSHSAIEDWLTKKLGAVGSKVHTGRSRNDQVQVALRLYMKDRLNRLATRCANFGETLLNRAEEMHDWPMPGYTHLQRAVPSSVGLWLGGLAEGFIDIAGLAQMTATWMNTCPLGTAAGYGVNLPLDREGVSDELGFDRVQINPMYAQNSRGRFELQALSVLAQASLELRRFAWDLSLFATGEFNFITMPSRYVTGSSIMPNKKNPDVVEILRGHHGVVQGAMAELQAIISLPSGYHRDLQLTKPPLLRAFEAMGPALIVVDDLAKDMILNRKTMADAIESDMFATDITIEAATSGENFRDAYKAAMDVDMSNRKAEDSLKARTSLGGCANLGLDKIRERLTLIKSSQ